MILLKSMLLLGIIVICTQLGIMKSKTYKYRLEQLQEMKNILNILKTKIKFTYEPIPEIFASIASSTDDKKIADIFRKSSEDMKYLPAGKAFDKNIDNAETYLLDEDKKVIKTLSKLLGKTDIEGQISEIELTDKYLDDQIQKAKESKNKNEKLYKTIGIVTGSTIAIILI